MTTFKPGDVAMVPRMDGSETLGMWGGWNWHCADAGGAQIDQSRDPRPLLVIDTHMDLPSGIGPRLAGDLLAAAAEIVNHTEKRKTHEARLLGYLAKKFDEVFAGSLPEVFEHMTVSKAGGSAIALCGKVWSPIAGARVAGRCPECAKTADGMWVA